MMAWCVITYNRTMSRWPSGTRERLRTAAIELFREQGFAATTVPMVTERAGLTTRTFYRHFADKRDVLFPHPEDQLDLGAILEHVPGEMTTAALLAWGLNWIASEFKGHREDMRLTQMLINTDSGLQERALRKREMLTSVFEGVLQARGVEANEARLLSDSTVSALYIALDIWLASDTEVRIDAIAIQALAKLRIDLGGIDGAAVGLPDV